MNLPRLILASASRGSDPMPDRKSTRLNSSHDQISYAVFCLKKKKKIDDDNRVGSRRDESCRGGCDAGPHSPRKTEAYVRRTATNDLSLPPSHHLISDATSGSRCAPGV